MTTHAVEIRILGKMHRVNCPAGQEQALILAARDLDSRLRELAERTKVSNTEKLLTIAALNACYELGLEMQQKSDEEARLQQCVLSLQEKIEEAFCKHNNIAQSVARANSTT